MLQRGGSRKRRNLPQCQDIRREEALRLSIGALKGLGLLDESRELAKLSGLVSEVSPLQSLRQAIEQRNWSTAFKLVQEYGFSTEKDRLGALERVFKVWIGHLVNEGELLEAVGTLQKNIFPIIPLITPDLCWSLFNPLADAVPDQEAKLMAFLASRCKTLSQVSEDRLSDILQAARAFIELNGGSLRMDVLDLVVCILETQGYTELTLKLANKSNVSAHALKSAIFASEWERALELAGKHKDQVLRFAVTDMAGTAEGVSLVQRHASSENRKELSNLLMCSKSVPKEQLVEELFPSAEHVFECAQKYEAMFDDYALEGRHSLCVAVHSDGDEFPGVCTETLPHDNEVWEVALSSCGKLLACGTRSGTICIWSLGVDNRFSLKSQFNGVHSDGVQAMEWNGHKLLSGGADGMFTIIDADSSTIILSQRCPDTDEKTDIAAVGWYKDSFFTGSYDGQIIQWDMDGCEIWRHHGVRVLSMSIGGSVLTVLSVLFKKKGHSLLTINLETKTAVMSTLSLRLSSLSTSCHGPAVHTQPTGVRLIDSNRVFEGPVQKSWKIRGGFGGPMDKFYASGSEDKCVYVFNSWSGRCIRKLEGHAAAVNTAIWGPNARFIVSAGDDCTVKIWRSS